MKKIFKRLILLGLIGILGYLSFSLLTENFNEKKEVQKFCEKKCSYSEVSYFWEFAAEGPIKGFTTRDECFNYCQKIRMGFTYLIKDHTAAFLEGAINAFRK